MASEDDGSNPHKRRRVSPRRPAPYVLRKLLDKVPLDAEDGSGDVHITCVEYWNENLYIGTSAAEILHFVCLQPDGTGDSNEPSFILATRLPLPFSRTKAANSSQHGVQQILLLPAVNKACVLCNGVVTFYFLPELSPAFGNTKVSNCLWIGGLDLNGVQDDSEKPVIMIALQDKIRLARIGDEAHVVRTIEFPGCLVALRRGTIACVADAHKYSLLEVEHRQKIPLFPISTSTEVAESADVEESLPFSRAISKNLTSASYPNSPPPENHGHNRSTSLNVVGTLQSDVRPEIMRPKTPDPLPVSSMRSRSVSQDRDGKGSSRSSFDKQTSNPQINRADGSKPLPPLPKPASFRLKPHVLSPTASEFLLVTGTEKSEPGVGMFVNIDGDVVRGTLNFERYPDAVIFDGSEEEDPLHPVSDPQAEHILAVIDTYEECETRKRLEVQKWDVNPGEEQRHKDFVDIPLLGSTTSTNVGVHKTAGPSQLEFPELERLLQMVRLKIPPLSQLAGSADPRTQASIEQHQKEKELFESQELTDAEGSKKTRSSESGWEIERNAEEAEFAHGLGKVKSSILLWSGDQIWRVVRNPLTIQLEDAIKSAQRVGEDGSVSLQRDVILDTIESIQEEEPKSVAEFLNLNYVRQKASLLLFWDLLFMDPSVRDQEMIEQTEKALLAGNLDPRIALLMVPLLCDEVLQSPQGIWTNAGLAEIAEDCLQRADQLRKPNSPAVDDVLSHMIKRFLFAWQQKRGYGSITDEKYVFDSVDAALLHLLLELDSHTRPTPMSVREELYNLIDRWKGNFERAVTLLESYHRLYALSRLYHSQRMSGNVLKTWRRIIAGERDDGGESTVSGIEQQMRKYLVAIKDAQLVEEFGSWLAARNPSLGVQVFADDTSKVKLGPTDIIKLLKERAPNAMQVYLEHLVFNKNCTQYADDLISYYLDNVLSVLESSPEARDSLSESYSAYRALRPPKPTYINFLTENLPAASWWQSRLRLLQLLGGGASSLFTATPSFAMLNYSIPAVLARIEPFQDLMVSECIILDGLQGRHEQALRLLTHGLSDYDSAIRYCLFGGPRSMTPSGALADFAELSLQKELFRHILNEFLQIKDISERIERTSDLLARFSTWFDVSEVLSAVPSDWSVNILSGFFVHVFRTVISQSREVRIERALSATLNLRMSAEYIDGVDKAGAWIEDEDGLRNVKEKGVRSAKQPGTDDGSDFGDIVEAEISTPEQDDFR